MTHYSKPAPSLGEACLLIAICFGWFILVSIDAVLRGFPTSGSFSDANLVSLMVLECFLGILALAFLRHRGYSIAELLPSPTWRGSASGLLLALGAFFACWFVEQAFSSRQLESQPIVEIVNNAKPSLLVALLLSMLNGLYEETFLLGYLVRGFASAGASFALGLSLLVRVLYHLYQGPIGAISVLIFGLVVGIYYWRTRTLWPAVFAHILADAAALI